MTREDIAKSLKPIKWRDDTYKPNEVFLIAVFDRRYATIYGVPGRNMTITIYARYYNMPDPPVTYKGVTMDEAKMIARYWQIEEEYRRLQIEEQKEKERKAKMLDDIKDHILENVTLHFSCLNNGCLWESDTPIGRYSIRHSDRGYYIMMPDDQYYVGGYNSLENAKERCVDHYKYSLIDAIKEGSKQ